MKPDQKGNEDPVLKAKKKKDKTGVKKPGPSGRPSKESPSFG